MGVFGDRLRREREMRGVTLDEIAESTKISRRSLDALEEENFDLLPGGIFNKGFVRAYARYLGIDEEQAVADYVAATQEQPPAEDKFPLEVHEGKKDSRPPLNPKRSSMPIVLAVIALALGVGGWTYWAKHKPQAEHSRGDLNAPTTVTPSTPSSAPAQPPAAKPASGPASSPSDQKPLDSNTGKGPDTASSVPKQNLSIAGTTGKQNSSSNTANENRSTEGAVKPASSSADARQFTVSVKAKEDSWVSIQADGRTVIEGTLKAGKQRPVTASKELVLKIGNAGGVEVSYNGKPVGPLGEQGEARTLTFNASGREQ